MIDAKQCAKRTDGPETICTRFQGNPVLVPDADILGSDTNILGPDNISGEDGIYNPGVFGLDGTVFLIPRVRDRRTRESWFTLAWSEDGYAYERLSYPIMFDSVSYEHPVMSRERETGGVEDCRITVTDGTIYLVYTGYGRTCQICLARMEVTRFMELWNHSREIGDDLRDCWNRAWKRLGPVFPDVAATGENFTRNGCIFPHDNVWYLVYRQGYGDVWLARAEGPEGPWCPVQLLVSREHSWEENRIGISSPPVPLGNDRFLFLYHGVENAPPYHHLDYHRTYHIGAFVATFPAKGSRRTGALPAEFSGRKGGGVQVKKMKTPLLSPREYYEIKAGHWLYNDTVKVAAVFCCGMVVRGTDLLIPYAAGDHHICIATADCGAVVRACEGT